MEYKERFAEDYRRIARDALSGKWLIAVIVGLIASLLSGADGSGPELNFNLNNGNANLELNYAGQTLFNTDGGTGGVMGGLLAGGILHVFVAAVVLTAVYFVSGSVVEVGYSRFNLELVDRRTPALENLFAYSSGWRNTALTRFFKSLHIFIGTLLLVVPGIIAAYSYAMTGYIQAEYPELGYRDVLALSKRMMEGNKWRLFCLRFSFIGWDLLCAVSLGIGALFLRPYKQAATAAFYREVSGTEQAVLEREPWDN